MDNTQNQRHHSDDNLTDTPSYCYGTVWIFRALWDSVYKLPKCKYLLHNCLFRLECLSNCLSSLNLAAGRCNGMSVFDSQFTSELIVAGLFFMKRVRLFNTVRCRYNAVNFLQNIHGRHPIARPSGRGMDCLLGFSLWLIFCLRSCNGMCNIIRY